MKTISSAVLLFGSVVAAASAPLPGPELLRRFSVPDTALDRAVFACACPGAVAFCQEWDVKWREQAAPEVRDQSVRDCVLDFMKAVRGE